MISKWPLTNIDFILQKIKTFIRIASCICVVLYLFFAIYFPMSGGNEPFPGAAFLLVYAFLWLQIPTVAATMLLTGYCIWKKIAVWPFLKRELWWMLFGIIALALVFTSGYYAAPPQEPHV